MKAILSLASMAKSLYAIIYFPLVLVFGVSVVFLTCTVSELRYSGCI